MFRIPTLCSAIPLSVVRDSELFLHVDLNGCYGLEQQIKFYKQAFAVGNVYYEWIAGAESGRQCKNINRLSGLAYDPEVYFNPSAVAFTADEVLHDSHADTSERSKATVVSRIQEYFNV